ncbi:hypothetical protein BC937DRAFT_90502 [Endogone sp. FLAS-F59071]|nr:hypothetical protein BC937DRAFT_90502 [Endogone sp. FLAS-F59071]|eukprot:RUS17043.1 hypothetical protein BC937DRAFT_90502 [Endogone sp. FLAS-F59071]
MARHQSAIHHANKVIHVLECPPDLEDTAPISEIIARLHSGTTQSLPPLPQVRHGKVLLPLIWKIDNDVPEYVIGDSMRLMQIMINLCSNAVKKFETGEN